MRLPTIALSCLVLSLTATSIAQAKRSQVEYYNQRIERTVENVQYMQRVMGLHVKRSSGSFARTNSMRYRLWVLKHWKRVNAKISYRYHHPPHEQAWLCIHHYEGSWTDTGDPYWGGMQEDISFQKSYAPYLYYTKGTADHWTPLEQMWSAERAYKSRGFWPWPNTARYCGLL